MKDTEEPFLDRSQLSKKSTETPDLEIQIKPKFFGEDSSSEKLSGSNSESNIHPQIENEKTERLLVCYMIVAGLVSMFPLFMMLAEVHTFQKKFKKYNFEFFVLMPTYACIPYGLLLGSFMKPLSYKK
jgi:hypothetical protein